MAELCNVLISSSGRRVVLLRLFRSALQALGLSGELFAVDINERSAAFHDADRGILVPSCTAPEFIPTMLEVCQRHRIRLVVPTIDTELAAYAESREQFARVGTTVAVSSPETIAICSDKMRTHTWLTESGFPTVRQARIEQDKLDLRGWHFPLLVKPCRGSASLGVRVVRTAEELRVATTDGEFVVQTLAPGVEYTVDLFVDNEGRCRCAVPRQRLEVRGGEVSKGMTVRHSALESLAVRIAEALPGARAVLNVQVFVDHDSGQLNVIEINPRFGGGFPLAWQAGALYPQWLLEEALGRPTTVAADNWRSGLTMLRYDDAVFVDAEEDA